MTDKTRESNRPKVVRTKSVPPAGRVARLGAGERPERSAVATYPRGFLFRLYVTGNTPASSRAIERVRRVCNEHLLDRYDLEVIDIYQKPALARDEQIIATPTLIKVLPVPPRRFIGDLSNVESLLLGLDLHGETNG